MPDEVGTETTRSDAPSADDALFGETADDRTPAVDEQDFDAENAPEQQAAGEKVAGDEAPQEEQDAGEAGEPADDEAKATADDPTPSEDDLKIVVSIKSGRATIGVQRPSADPHIETFEDHDLPGLAQEVTAVVERARAGWEDVPKHPAYERPAPPARRGNRRQQGAGQAANTETETDQAQQTLRLF